jgi:hypothetical protein
MILSLHLNHSFILDIRAIMAKTKIQRLQNQLEIESNQRAPILQTSDASISSTEAFRLLNQFAGNLNEVQNENQAFREQQELEVLQSMEVEFQSTQKEYQEAARALQSTQQQVTVAIRAEKVAQEKLLQAQQDLANAQAYYYDTQQQQLEAEQVEQNFAVKAQRQTSLLNRQSTRVKSILRKAEKRSRQQQAVQLKRDMQSLQASADAWERDSLHIKQRAMQMKQQQKDQQQQSQE